MSTRSDSLLEIDVYIHRESKHAWHLSLDGVEAEAVWVPKSQAEYEPGRKPHCGVLTAPEWLAIEKGLI